jgi:hypothetical protein
MGYERTIPMAADRVPDWGTIARQLRLAGDSPVLRMIDGLPAFPDETPEPTWRELRVGLAGGMITIRRTADGISCVSWGTDDPHLKTAFERTVAAIHDSVTR